MFHFKSSDELCDMMSFVIKNKFVSDYYLKITDSYISFPTTQATSNGWKVTAESTLKNLTGKILPFEPLKMYKVWVPNHSLPSLTHMVFLAKVDAKTERPTSYKKGKKTIQQWIGKQQIDEMKNQEFYSDPYIYLAIALAEKKSITTVAKATVTDSDGFITDVTEDDVILSTKNTTTEHFELLQAAGLNRNDQMALFKEYLCFVFPSLTMNRVMFDEVIGENFGIPYDQLPDLFRAADVLNSKTLSYRDFIYICAACDPNVPHMGTMGEIRCRYLFRFLDRNSDNIMDFDDFVRLIELIKKSKNQVASPAIARRDATQLAESIGLKGTATKITLSEFLKLVGNLKIRGTAAVLRFNKPIKEFLELRQSMCKMKTSSTRFTAVAEKLNGETIRTYKTSLTSHTLRMKQFGAMIDIEKLYDKEFISPNSSKLIRDLVTKHSVENFNQRFYGNEVINTLKYFSQQLGSDPIEKAAYSWGSYDMLPFATALIKVCNDVKIILKKEPRMVQISSPCYVMGDLHGNFLDLMYFERVLWHLSPTLSPSSLVFLGDFVDRGPFGLEVVSYLFAYKLQNPDKVFLIRGNHETRDIQRNFTFYQECINKFREKLAADVWTAINNVFDVMPIAGVIDNRMFCCHGGIPPPWLCPKASAINDIPSPLSLPDQQSQLAWNLMWNDPANPNLLNDAMRRELQLNDGFAKNTRRGTGFIFNAQAMDAFLTRNNFTHLIRAHELQPYGINICFRGKLLSVFSSSKYCGGTNEAACVSIEKGKIRVLRMETR